MNHTFDITVRDEGVFWGLRIWPRSKKGIEICKAWNRGVEKSNFYVPYSLQAYFMSNAKDLSIENI